MRQKMPPEREEERLIPSLPQQHRLLPSPHTYFATPREQQQSGTDSLAWAMRPDDRPGSSRVPPQRWSPSVPERLPPLTDFTRPMSSYSSYGNRPPSSSTQSFTHSHQTSPNRILLTPISSQFDPIPRQRPTSSTLSPVEIVRSPSLSLSALMDTPKDPSPGKRKKRRVALACAECSKRKQKCNRETPCNHCIARRVPELCVPSTTTSSPKERNISKLVKTEDTVSAGPVEMAPRAPSLLPTLSVRVGRIEAMLNSVLNKVEGLEGKALREWRISEWRN